MGKKNRIKKRRRVNDSPGSEGGEAAAVKRDSVSTELEESKSGNSRDALRYILILFVTTRVFLTVTGVLARAFIGEFQTAGPIAQYGILGTGQAWLDIWGVWDSRWYLTIAENWYVAEKAAGGYVSYAFFPLYPLLIKWGPGLIFGNFAGGIVVSNLALIGAAWFLYKLVGMRAGHETGKKAVLFMFLFPSAFYFSAILTESLFALVSIASVYFARRNNWLAAGLLGGCAALTRSVGLFLAVPLLLEYLSQKNYRIRNIRPDFLFLGILPLGTLIFALICYSVTGNPLALAQSQSAWGGSLTNPLWSLWDSLFGSHQGIAQSWLDINSYSLLGWDNIIPGAVLGAVISIYCLYYLVKGFRKTEISLFVYSMMLILFPLSTLSFATFSMSRYCLVVFPVFMILAHTIKKGGVLYWATLLVFAILQTVAMALWTNGFHIV
ncbi:MAG: mannosyltransferase family protein [Candidatus Dadabacteria bacterium]|nr:mannosyltransferase family protein [Candidatus Dadabacteria bacterium]